MTAQRMLSVRGGRVPVHGARFKVRVHACTSILLALATSVAAGCDSNATGPLEPTAFAAFAAGARHTCGISVGGVVYCWGLGDAGELGDGTFETSFAPRRIGGDVAFSAISAGFRHTCAVTADRDLWCWGWNVHGQLGNASTVGQGLPIPVASNLRVQQVTAGWRHTCALTVSADAYCWGSNGQGQLGDGSTTTRLAATRVAGGVKFAQLSAGGFHTCGISTAGVLFCWGLNHQGQLGTGDVTNATTPRRADTQNTFRQVSAGYAHSCALDSTNQPFCWGSNGAGELGVAFLSAPGEPGSMLPAQVHNASAGFLDIDAGFEFTCATRADGGGWCWGRGQDGQLGTGGFTSWVVAQPVADVRDFIAIDAGAGRHACGITSSSAILCWGRGDVGQLGNPGITRSAAPVRVPGVVR